MKTAEELSNASQYPQFFYAKHMYAGICGYDDKVVLIREDTMKKMSKTFAGKPVYVLHDDRDVQDRIENISDADGYVTENFYNEVDGWLWAKIMVKSDEGLEVIKKGWACSNAYIPHMFGEGGTKHNCPYDQEIIGAEFTHLALVDNPRYEDACVLTPDEFKVYQENGREQLNEMHNSKSKKGRTMSLKLFKNKKEEVSDVDGDTMVEITNSKGEKEEVSIEEMVNALTAKKKAESQNAKKIDVGGKKMTIAEIVNAYKETVEAENEDDEMDNEDDETENSDDEMDNEDDESCNADDEMDNEDDEKENECDDEKKNSKKGKNHFKELKNAHRKKPVAMRLDTPRNQLDRGKSRYGSVN